MHRAARPKISRLHQLAAVTLLLNAFVCLHALGRASEAIRGVISARETASAVGRVSASIKDAEIAARVYMLTGDAHDLAKLGKTLLKTQGPLDDLTKRSKGDPTFETRVASLGHVVRDRTDRLLEAARSRKRDPEAAAIALHSDRGQRSSAEVARLVAEMEGDEDRRLAEAEVSAHGAIGMTLLTVVLASSLALALLGVVYRMTRGEMERREAAAEAILEREEWFSATLASIGDPVIATDGQGRVRLINPAAQRLTGWSHADSTGKPLDVVVPLLGEDTRTPVLSPVSRILTEGRSVGPANHTLLVARDGTEYPVEHCGTPIRGQDGTITGVVLCFRDVAERKRAEVALRAAKEAADASNRAKDDFLAVLSHELRKPLTPVLLAAEGMLDRGAPPENRPALEMIRRNVGMASRLIDDLLDVSRVARGALRLHTELVDVHEMIRQAVAMFHAEARGAGLDVVLELSARRHHALADATRMAQVFWNLITNAVKFSPEGGRLECRTWDEEPGGLHAPAARLVVEFRDTGIGIEPGSLTRIFEPFEQGEASFARRFGGLGLGLAISRGIVEAHGGRMTATSPGRGKGASFLLDLPAAPPPAPRLPGPAQDATVPVRQAGLRLLIVEDDQDSLRYLALALRHRGYEIYTAGNLGAAQTLLRSGRELDLFISDLELPDGSGLDLMRDQPVLPGIAVSGYGSEEDVRASASAGFSAHLTKPVDLSRLEDAIRRVASRPAAG